MGAVPESYSEDAYHIAIAVINEVGYLLMFWVKLSMPMTEILMATAYNRVEFIRMKAKKVIGGDIYNNGTSPNRAYSGFGATHLHPNSPSGNFRYARNVVRNCGRRVRKRLKYDRHININEVIEKWLC